MKKLLTIITISALTVSTLVGCGKTNEKSDNTNEPTVVAEQPTETVEVTAEPTEKVESTEKVEITETPDTKNNPDGSEENLESREVDLTGYLEDYPLTLGDKKVYIKIPDGYETFDDKMNFWDNSYSDMYKGNTVFLFPNTITEFSAGSCSEYIFYSIENDTDEYTSKWYEENKDIGKPDFFGITSYKIESETFDNGITFYAVTPMYSENPGSTEYFFEYTIDDSIIKINLFGDNTSIIDYYKTATDIFVVK